MANLATSETRRNDLPQTDTPENECSWAAGTLTAQLRTDSGATGVEVKHL